GVNGFADRCVTTPPRGRLGWARPIPDRAHPEQWRAFPCALPLYMGCDPRASGPRCHRKHSTDPPQMSNFAIQRLNMVEAQVRPTAVTDSRIQRAMLEVPREAFVPPAVRAAAYADACVEVARGRVLLVPRCFATMIQE